MADREARQRAMSHACEFVGSSPWVSRAKAEVDGGPVRGRLIGALHDLDRRTNRPLTKGDIADEALRVVVEILREQPTPCDLDLYGSAADLLSGP